MKKVLFLIVTLVCAVTRAWADTSTGLENGTTGSFFLYESGTPADHSLNANAGYKALIGADTYQSGKKWTPIEKSDAGTNVQYQNEQNWITNNAQNGNPGDVVAVPNGESEYQYYIKVVVDNNTKGSWEGPLSTAPEGVTSFNDIIPNQVNQYQDETMSAGTYYYRVSVPLYNYYRKVRYWEPKTLTGRQDVTYYEVGTDVSTLAVPTSDGGKIAIGGDYWYVDNGRWVSTAVSDDTDYIRLKEGTTNVYEVHVTAPGNFSYIYNADGSSYADGSRFVFDNECYVNKDDLLCILKDNKYYVDLFNITNGDNTPMKIDNYLTEEDNDNADNIDMVMEAAVADMVANGYQARGIILPYNTGSGTTKVEKARNVDGLPTFTEYAAYYRNSQKVAAIHVYDMNTFYDEKSPIKKDDGTGAQPTGAQPNFEIAAGHVLIHQEIATYAEIYMVGTNNRNKLTLKGVIPAGKTEIVLAGDEMVKANHTNLADIYVKTVDAGDFAAAVAGTGVKGTPCDELIIEGPVKADDIAAVNDFSSSEVAGPITYNLAEAKVSDTGITQEMLSALTNSKIEYIILPGGAKKPVVGDYVGLANLKCVISSNKSSDEAHVLTAYVRTAGSLAEARCLATENKQSGNNFEPRGQGLTTVKLMGNLNASDINVSGAAGNGLANEASTIATLDLEDAIFANVNDMILNNSAAGFGDVLQEVKLPNNENMTEIPEEFLFGLSSIHNLHIPYYYKKIGWKAFYETGIDHITTEDANGALIDNGEKTYTFSANIEELGAPGKANSGQAVFPHDSKITDVYCLATKVPTCYASTFAMQVTFANGGANDGPYCREKYITSEDGGKVIAVLHFPNEESFNNVKNAEDKETNYATMKSLYTDPERVFTKKDQTGAVDTKGNPLLWPDQKELESSYYSAQAGHIWTDYELKYADDGHMEDLGALKNSQTQPFCPNYVGWHEFVLSQANYVDPDETVINEVVERKYEDAGWYTICIPYNLTRSQVLNMMGVPASNSKIKNYLLSKNETNNTTTYGEVTTDLMPDIRQLKSVTRKKKGEGDSQNQVKFYLTKDLYGKNESQPTHTYYLNFTEKDGYVTEVGEADADGNNNSVDPICLVGGRPYIIKIYKREGVTISQQNIGKYILTHYGDELGLPASCLNNGSDYYEQLMDEEAEKKNLVTLQFVKPYEKHLVQALVDDKNNPTPITYTENGKKYRYYYAMQGQFWDQDLPEYCFYISKGKWFHYMNKSKNYKWNAYKCVIMATPLEVEVTSPVIPTTAAQVVEKQKIDQDAIVIGDIAVTDKPTVKAEIEKANAGALNWKSHWGLGFRWYPFCWFPQPEPKTADLLKSNFRLGFMGRDDDDFDKWGMARYIFDFDGDSVVEYDEDGNETTAIDMLDGESQRTDRSGKVYSISGQYMGTTTENLPKGIYVVGGRKIVVD